MPAPGKGSDSAAGLGLSSEIADSKTRRWRSEVTLDADIPALAQNHKKKFRKTKCTESDEILYAPAMPRYRCASHSGCLRTIFSCRGSDRSTLSVIADTTANSNRFSS